MAIEVPDLADLPAEAEKSAKSVRVIVQHKSASYVRRFESTSRMVDVYLWINHQMVAAGVPHLVNAYCLKTRFPPEIYRSSTRTLCQVGLCQEESSKREMQVRLFVDEDE